MVNWKKVLDFLATTIYLSVPPTFSSY